MNLIEKYEEIRTVSPIPKLVWMILLISIRDKCKVLTLELKRNDGEHMTITMDGEHEMVPPPRHLSCTILDMVCRIGREAAKNQKSSFGFLYTETGSGQTLQWLTCYDNEDAPGTELDTLMQKIVDEETAAEELKTQEKRRRELQKQSMIGIIITLTAIIFIMSYLAS